MIVTKNHIGEIVCEYSSGNRFLVSNVSDRFLFFHLENGNSECINGHKIDGGIERDDSRVSSFRNNLALAQALKAAELATLRRLVPGQYSSLEQQEAARVLKVVGNQRTNFLARLQHERNMMKAGPALAEQFIEELDAFGSGASGIFFGANVKCVQNSVRYLINGNQSVDSSAIKECLSDLVPKEHHKSLSLDEKLSAAIDRSSGQSWISVGPAEKCR